MPPSVGFYSLQHPEWPPAPANVLGLYVWEFGDGTYLLSDLDEDYDGGLMRDDDPMPPGGGEGGEGEEWGYGQTSMSKIYTTNDLWLEITNVSPNYTLSYLLIHPAWNETNGIWDAS